MPISPIFSVGKDRGKTVQVACRLIFYQLSFLYTQKQAFLGLAFFEKEGFQPIFSCKLCPMAKFFSFCISIMASVQLMQSCAPTKKLPDMKNQRVEITTTLPADTSLTDDYLEAILKRNPYLFGKLLSQKEALNIQIIYTQIDRGANNNPNLKTYRYNVNPAHYFYPASTVKLPICLLALQKLQSLKSSGIDLHTTMITEIGHASQSAVYNDPSAIDGRPSIAQYIKKILMVSDNDAYNRLYEFLGQEYINQELHNKGYKDVQILHRLQTSLSVKDNRITNPISFLDSTGKLVYSQPMVENKTTYLPRTDSMGIGYIAGGNLVKGPMDFSNKNRIALEDLHKILISLVFPSAVPAAQQFNISEEDRMFMLKYLSQLPNESSYPPYASDTNYWPAYCKFLLFGAEKGPIPPAIRVFNKVGDAYGQMLDIAYLVDYDKKIEFFLSAAIYCNSDGILNDDKYDYNSIGFPFMKNLGKIIYDFELGRQKKRLPDLSKLIFTYDK
jgi:hypothetical protein